MNSLIPWSSSMTIFALYLLMCPGGFSPRLRPDCRASPMQICQTELAYMLSHPGINQTLSASTPTGGIS